MTRGRPELGHLDRRAVAGGVFVFVPDLEAGCAWYAALWGSEPERPMPQLALWNIGDFRFTLHAEDEFNTSGATAIGTVAYFDVDDVDATITQCVERGATVHRGPKTVFSGERLVQIQDPFGNLLGFRQPPA